MITYIIDIAIVLALAFFVWRGANKGLILMLFSLLAIFVAWFGAKAVAGSFTRPVANIIRPSIELSINEVLEGAIPSGPADPEPSPSTPAVTLPGGPSEVGGEKTPSGDFTPGQILELMKQSEIFTGLWGFLEQAIAENTLEVTSTAAAAVSAYLAELIASAFLFGGSFLLILLVWFLVSRALDLAFKLPVLSAVNAVGGGLFGLVKGVLIILVLVWLLRLSGFLTEENAGPVARFMTVESVSRLLNGLIQGAAPGFSSAA